jgi:hypothetical protein
MSDIEDILVHAWNKDAVNLAPAIDSVMTSKAAEAINNMFPSVAAQMFGYEPEIQNEEPQAEFSDETTETQIEEPSDEVTQ